MRELADEAEARQAVDAGDADAAVVDAGRIVVRAEPPDQLVGLIQAVSVREQFAPGADRRGTLARPESTQRSRNRRCRSTRSSR